MNINRAYINLAHIIYANVFAVVDKNTCNGDVHKQVVNCTKYIWASTSLQDPCKLRPYH